MDHQELIEKVDRLQAEVTRLSEERLPHVDRSSRRRDQRLGGAFTLLAVAALGLAGLGSASALDGTNTVFTDDLVANAVTSSKIADGTIGGVDIRDASIASVDIKDAGIASVDIKDGNVGSGDILDSSVNSVDVTNESLTGADLADGTVDGLDIKNHSIAGNDVADASLTSADIDESLNSGDIYNGSLTGNDVHDGSLTGADVADGSLTGWDVNLFNDDHCSGETVQGTAAINGDPLVPSTFNSDWVGWAHSCSGAQVEVARFGVGEYVVDFDNPARLAVATPSVLNNQSVGISIENFGVGSFRVRLWDGYTGYAVDSDFSILAY